MNKRKVLSILLLALITVTLAVSCSGNINTPAANTEELSYVTFGNGHSREIGTSYETKDYGELFWFYTATKDDQYGTTGVTSTEKPVSKNSNGAHIPGLSGSVGPFSQGAWKFTLYAYAEGVTAQGVGTGEPNKSNLIYMSDEVPVILKGGDVKNVPVSVTTQGSYGTIQVQDAYFEWKKDANNTPNGGTTPPSIKFSLINTAGENIATGMDPALSFAYDSASKTFKLPNNTYTNIPVGYYTGIVSVYLNGTATDGTTINNEGTPVYTQSFGVRIYGNATTYISGNMVEGVDSKVTFDVPEQEMVIFTVVKDNNTEVTVPVSPKGASGSNTVVSFPSGALDTSAVHQLNVTVTPTASAEQKFQISSTTGNAAVAGIDLTMVKVQKNDDGSTKEVNVTNFNNQAVTITTYIATGLKSVEVKYLNDNNLDHIAGPITNITGCPSYDPETGKLVFSTKHFSQYVVVSPIEAINVNTGVPYTSIVTAIADAKDGHEVKVMKDVVFNSTISIEGKNITLNLNGKTLTTVNNVPRFFNVLSNSNIVITGNGVLSGLTDANAAAQNENSLIKVENSILTIENGTLTAGGANGNGLYGIFVAEGGNLILGTAENGPTITTYFAAVSSNNTTSPANIIVNNGSFTCTSAENVSGNSGNRDWECAAFYLPASGTYEFNGGTVTGSKYAISTPYYNVKLDINISGGTYSGSVSAILKDNKEGSGASTTDERVITITGGTFSSDPKDYVAKGYVAIKQGDQYSVQVAPVKIGDNGYASLNDAIASIGAEQDNIVITLGEGEFRTDNINVNNAKNKTITIIGQGMDKTSWVTCDNVINHVSIFADSTLTLENLSIKDSKGNSNYRGMAHTASETFINCKFINRLSYFGNGPVIFTNCIFDVSNDYSLYTYGGSSFEFENCKFNSDVGKFINAYVEIPMTTSTTKITISNCSFIVKESAQQFYPAVCLKKQGNTAGSYQGWILEITNTNLNRNGKDVSYQLSSSSLVNSGSYLYAIQKETNSNDYVEGIFKVTIDGETKVDTTSSNITN